MDAKLRELIDYHDIKKVLYQYCHGCDRADFARMAGVYAHDSWDDHGLNKCTGQAFTAIIMKSMPNNSMVNHLLGQSLISVTDDEAGAETSFIAHMRNTRADGVEMLNQIGGRYVDTLVKEGSDWKIKRRLCVKEWSISWPITDDWLGDIAYVEPRRSNDDPSYAVLGVTHSGTLV